MQAAVISMRYGIGDEMLEPMSMTAIGQVLNMSRDRVRTLENKAITSSYENAIRMRSVNISNTMEKRVRRINGRNQRDSSESCIIWSK